MENEDEKRFARVQSTANNDVIRSKHQTVWDGERALYMLLADHPVFVDGVAKTRKHLGIPQSGFTDAQKAFDWAHANKSNKSVLRDAIEKLLADFNIKSAFRSEAKFFAYDYALSPKIVENQLPLPKDLHPVQVEEIIKRVGRHKIGAQVIQTHGDVESRKYQFKANALYLEFTEHTTWRDAEIALMHATKRKKNALPFAMPKVQVAPRYAWQLFSAKKKNGMSNSKIAEAVNAKFRVRLTPQHVPSYAGRYEKALRILRPFHSK